MTELELDYAAVMQLVRENVQLGDSFRVVDLRRAVDYEDDAMRINRAIYQMSQYGDPVFAHNTRGEYTWLREHLPTKRGAYEVRPRRKADYCPDCHMALPSAGDCGYC